MTRIDERVARCFGLLRSPEFEPLIKFWRESRLDTLEDLVLTKDQTRIYTLQGAAGTLGEILDRVDGADKLISKLKANGRA